MVFSKAFLEFVAQVESGRINKEHPKWFLVNPDAVLPEIIDGWTEACIGPVHNRPRKGVVDRNGNAFPSDFSNRFVGIVNGEPVYCRHMCGSDDDDEEPFTIYHGETKVASGEFHEVQIANGEILFIQTFRDGRYTDLYKGSKIYYGGKVISETGFACNVSCAGSPKALLYRIVSRDGQQVVWRDRRFRLPGTGVHYLHVQKERVVCLVEYNEANGKLPGQVFLEGRPFGCKIDDVSRIRSLTIFGGQLAYVHDGLAELADQRGSMLYVSVGNDLRRFDIKQSLAASRDIRHFGSSSDHLYFVARSADNNKDHLHLIDQLFRSIGLSKGYDEIFDLKVTSDEISFGACDRGKLYHVSRLIRVA